MSKLVRFCLRSDLSKLVRFCLRSAAAICAGGSGLDLISSMGSTDLFSDFISVSSSLCSGSSSSMGMSDLMTVSSDFTASSDFSDSDFSLSSLGDLVLKSILEAGD